MKNVLTKQLYWILPAVVMVAGLLLLFRDNYLQVTAPPKDGWSNALQVGTTISNHLLHVRQTEDGLIIMPQLKNGILEANTYDEDFVLLDENSYAIHSDKWSDVYIEHDLFIYFTKQTMYDQNNEELITDVDGFFPLDSTLLYTKENQLYEFDPKQRKSTEVLDLNKKQVIMSASASGTYILCYETDENEALKIELHELGNGKASPLSTFSLPLKRGRAVDDISFTAADGELALVMQTKQKNIQGVTDLTTHLLHAPFSEAGEGKISAITFPDPETGEQLREVSNISIQLVKGVPHLLFQANGYTETTFNKKRAFNIYEADVRSGEVNSARRSNTPGVSTKPEWINDTAVMWMESGADGNDIYVSSSDHDIIAKTSQFNQETFLGALGKTMGQAAISLSMILISVIWVIWPLTFIILMHLFRTRTLAREPRWVFYAGIGIYAAAALTFNDVLFTKNITVTAPAYLNFAGSFYLYMGIFALLAFAAVQLARWKEWSISAKIMYFTAVHILMLTAFFGPYLV